MIKRLFLVAAFTASLAGASFAQEKPAAAPQQPAAEQPAAQAPAAQPPAAQAPAAQPPAAQEQVADPAADECLKKAFDVAQTAEQKKLTELDLDTLENLLSKMEAHCDANQFADADKVGADVKKLLDSKQ